MSDKKRYWYSVTPKGIGEVVIFIVCISLGVFPLLASVGSWENAVFGLGFGFFFGLCGGLWGLTTGLGWGLVFGLVNGLLWKLVNESSGSRPIFFWAGGSFCGFVSVLIVLIFRPFSQTIIKGLAEPYLFLRNAWMVVKAPLLAFFVLYLVVTILFAGFYGMINHCYSERGEVAFKFPQEMTRKPTLFDFCYFSLVTIATLGYGDISPLNALAKAIASLEVIVGIGLVVVYFAFLTMHLQEKLKKPVQEKLMKKKPNGKRGFRNDSKIKPD